MKKLFVLLIGFSCCALPMHTYAQTPISEHYVEPILQRADDGIANAQSSYSASNFNMVFLNWLTQLTSVFLELVDTDLRITEYQRNLISVTACYHHDLKLIEEKIEEVRDELDLAFQDKRIADIIRLQSLVRFLNARMRHLIAGGTDPDYIDEQFHWLFSFDEQGWCCNKDDGFNCVLENRVQCARNKGLPLASWTLCEANSCDTPFPEPEEESMCPFHSDYLPPTGAGYGCDLETINSINLGFHVSTAFEYDGLDAFVDARDEFLNDVDYIRDITLSILNSLGRDTSAITSRLDNFLKGRESEREHRTRIGCNRFDGDTIEPPPADTDPPNLFPEGAARIELRGPFYLTKNEVALLRGLFYQLRAWGERREQADYLKFPSEYPDGSTEQTDAQDREDDLGDFQKYTRLYMRNYFERWNREHSGREAEIVMQSTDTQQQITAMLKPLRTVMRDFSRYASKQQFGARKFTRGLAWYLRRSCMFRTCSKQLDHILKINFEDICFPYTDGQYIGNPTIHEQCRNDADVTEGIE